MSNSWFEGLFFGRSSRPRRATKRPLSLEALESRLVPTSTELISVAADGSTGDASASLGASKSAVSTDGRYVVFESAANDLIAGQDDQNGVRDVFLRDRQTNATILVSRQAGSTTTTGDFLSFDPSISADGRYVVYRSTATHLVGGQVDGFSSDVFLFDSATGVTTLVSHADGSATTAGNGGNSSARISADGNYVVFVSGATDLVTNQTSFDTNGSDDVFLYDRALGTTALVSQSSSGGVGNGFADSPSISDDGRYVAYRTAATNVAAGVADNNGNTDVYLYDRVATSRVLVSHTNGSASVTALGQSENPAVSGDGNYVAFVSYAGDVVQDQFDDNLSTDVFLYSRISGEIVLISHVAGSPESAGDNFADAPAISDDGRYVAYATSSSNLVPDQIDVNGDVDVFLYDSVSGESVLVSHNHLDAATSGEAFSTTPAISSDGRYVAYASVAGDLAAGVSDANGSYDVYRYDAQSGESVLLSYQDGDPSTASSLGSSEPSISGDGLVVVFVSQSADLVSGDDNGSDDVFAWSMAAANTAPAATITDVGASRDEGGAIAVSGAGTDAEQAPETLGYSWEVYKDGGATPFATGSGTGYSFTPDDDGSYRIVLTVTDGGGLSASDEQTITVSNVSPSPSIVSVGDVRVEGASIAVSGSATDAAGSNDTLSYSWQVFKDGGATPVATGNGADYSFTPDDDGSYRIVLTASDEDGGSASAEQTISVSNVAPSPSIVSIGAVRVEGTSIAVSGSATDPAGGNDALSYAWQVYKDGGATPFATGSGSEFAFTPDDDGSYRIVLTASDEDGGSASAEQTITVSNVAPTPSIVSIGAVRVEGTSIAVSGSATDPAGSNDTLSYSWQVYKDGAATPLATGSGTDFSFTPDDDGSYRIVLTVSDEDGGSDSAEQTIAVSNVAPTPSIVSIGAVRVEGTSISVSGSATDPAGANDALGYSWEVYKGGATPLATGTGGDFAFTPGDDGSYRIVLTVSDEDGGSASVEQTIAVSNVAPAPSIVSIGAVRVEGTSIAVSGSATDPAGANDTLSYSWQVFQNGGATPLATGTGGDFAFTPGDDGSYRIVLTVSDEDGGSASAEQTVTVSNAAPTPSIGTVSVVGKVVTVSGSATDPAGPHDTLSYFWELYEDGDLTPFATGSGLNPTLTAGADGLYRLLLTASDEDGGSDSIEQTVTIDTITTVSRPDLDAASDTGSSDTDDLTSDRTPTFSGTAEAGATVVLMEGTTALGTATADGSGGWSITPSPLSDGTHAVFARATDAVGNTADSDPTIVTIGDGPVNQVPPGQQVMSRRSPLVFSAGNGNAVRVVQAGTAGGDLRVTLTAAKGALTLGGTAGLTSVRGDRGATVILTGPLGAVNDALEGLSYSAGRFSGDTTLTVHTEELVGGRSDTDAVSIRVKHVPVKKDPTYRTRVNQALVVTAAAGLLAGASNPNHGSLAVELLTRPAGGRLLVNPDGSFTYAPKRGTSGQVRFRYRISDGSEISDPITVTLAVVRPGRRLGRS